jgi:hypothetical protein
LLQSRSDLVVHRSPEVLTAASAVLTTGAVDDIHGRDEVPVVTVAGRMVA